MKPSKILLYGGAFDPITIGHIQTAQYALKYSPIKFNSVWLMPSYKNIWDKKMVDENMRCDMIRSAILETNDKHIELFSYEIENKLVGGSIDILYNLFQDFSEDYWDFWFLIGMDHANDIESWKDSEKLIRIAKFAVVNRYGVKRNPEHMWYDEYPHFIINGDHTYPTDHLISSSLARDSISKNIYPTNILHKSVIEYIQKNNLYNKN
jgi:nicotinate-nucleotide adenylyltransferase